MNANHQESKAPNRLRNPVMNPMWTKSDAHQPAKPPSFSRPADTTAEPREM